MFWKLPSWELLRYKIGCEEQYKMSSAIIWRVSNGIQLKLQFKLKHLTLLFIKKQFNNNMTREIHILQASIFIVTSNGRQIQSKSNTILTLLYHKYYIYFAYLENGYWKKMYAITKITSNINKRLLEMTQYNSHS